MSRKINIVLRVWFAVLIFPFAVFAQGFSLLPGSTIMIPSGTTVSIDNLTLLPSVDLTINGDNSQTRNATIGHTSANSYIRRVYHYQSVITSFSGTIIIHYADTELNGLSETSLTLNVHDGVRWNAFLAASTRDPVTHSVTTTGLDKISLNELTLAASAKPLPVVFTLLQSVCAGQGIEISWTATNEENIKEYAVERSVHGSAWQIIGLVQPLHAQTTNQYRFTDRLPSGDDLYRIAEHDQDGKLFLSSVVQSSCNRKEDYVLFPNPAGDQVFIQINSVEEARAELRVYDAKGELVKTQELRLVKGYNQIVLDIKALKTATYQVVTSWSNKIRAATVIKQ